MKAERLKVDGSNTRKIKVSGLPDIIAEGEGAIRNDVPEMIVEVSYVGHSSARLAVPLDNIVIPAIVDALNRSSLGKMDIFHTPKDVKELEAKVNAYAGSGLGAHAVTIMGMTWNLCADLTAPKEG